MCCVCVSLWEFLPARKSTETPKNPPSFRNRRCGSRKRHAHTNTPREGGHCLFDLSCPLSGLFSGLFSGPFSTFISLSLPLPDGPESGAITAPKLWTAATPLQKACGGSRGKATVPCFKMMMARPPQSRTQSPNIHSKTAVNLCLRSRQRWGARLLWVPQRLRARRLPLPHREGGVEIVRRGRSSEAATERRSRSDAMCDFEAM